MPLHDLQNMAAYSVQIAMIAAAATVLLRVLAIPSPAVRYASWRLALGTCLIAPLLLRSTMPAGNATIVASVGTVENASTAAASPLHVPAAPPHRPMPWDRALLIIVLSGIGARAAWLALGFARLRMLRCRGTPLDDHIAADVQKILGTRAAVRSVEGLTQPVTFGVLRPVVLIPRTLEASPEPVRRAVITHEMFHVRRRDWLWLLVEEAVGVVLWFHPAVAWVRSRIQAAREEVVDELTVLATGDRRAYIEALLAFADAERVTPAPAFARHANLFSRIVTISKERVMSSQRIAFSAVAVPIVLGVAGWYGSILFPIVSAAPAAQAALVPQASIAGPEGRTDMRDRPRASSSTQLQGGRSGGSPRPEMPVGVQVPQPTAERRFNEVTPENPIPRRVYAVNAEYPSVLSVYGYTAEVTVRLVLDSTGSPASVSPGATTLSTPRPNAPPEPDRREVMQQFRSAAADAIRQWRYDPPVAAPLAFWVEVAFQPGRPAEVSQAGGVWTQTRLGLATAPAGGYAASNEQATRAERLAKLAALQSRLAAARFEKDHGALQQDALNAEIQELEKVLDDLKAQTADNTQTTFGATSSGRAPLRVGAVRPPTKIRDVPPVYPPSAADAHIEGVVILEVLIDEQGHVADTRVVRSVPQLDQAAITAVNQWQYEPTLLNGAPVPIVMNVTVQFTLSQ